jgi:hypothetical protein
MSNLIGQSRPQPASNIEGTRFPASALSMMRFLKSATSAEFSTTVTGINSKRAIQLIVVLLRLERVNGESWLP